MTLQEFIKKYEKKTVDFDGAYGGQCVDLFNKYLVDCLGITNPIQQFPVASAYQIFNYAKNNSSFVCIPNDPTAIPQAGDIMIWNQGVGPHGHVAIFVEGDVMSFRSFEQNWNGVQKCVIVNHPYDHITGWLRPKRNVPEVVRPAPQPIEAPKQEVKCEEKKEAPRPLIDAKLLDGNKTKIIAMITLVVGTLYSQGYIDEKLFNSLDLIVSGLVGYTLRDAIKKK